VAMDVEILLNTNKSFAASSWYLYLFRYLVIYSNVSVTTAFLICYCKLSKTFMQALLLLLMYFFLCRRNFHTDRKFA
jgi:hypothetical protein